MEYKRIPTHYEVWVTIRNAHPELVVHSSYSALEADYFGDPSVCKMMTEYGFKDSDMPIIGAESTWDSHSGNKRINGKHKYWLCIAVDDKS